MRALNKLTDKKITKAKPAERPYTLADGGGLVLQIHPSGARWWRFRYRFDGQERMISAGVYPDTDLKAARDKRDEYRKLLAAETPIDPSEKRKADKAARADSFKCVSDEWFGEKQAKKAKSTRKRTRHVLDLLTAKVGNQSVSKITTTTMQRVVRSIQKANGVEMAHRALGYSSNVFSYAIASGAASVDPTAGLKQSLKENKATHRAAITDPKQFGKLLRDIDQYPGQVTTRAALQLIALNFTRPGEIRLGKWEEIDLDKALWTIPQSRMKMRNKNASDHLLPLSAQSVSILKELKTLTGKGEWVFPTNKPKKPLSDAAFSNALKKMDYPSDTHTAHGFRSSASTMLHEMNFSPEVIETQLAHKRPGVAAIYNRSHLLPQRREMLQSWADYLDQLRDEKTNVVPINAQGAA